MSDRAIFEHLNTEDNSLDVQLLRECKFGRDLNVIRRLLEDRGNPLIGIPISTNDARASMESSRRSRNRVKTNDINYQSVIYYVIPTSGVYSRDVLSLILYEHMRKPFPDPNRNLPRMFRYCLRNRKHVKAEMLLSVYRLDVSTMNSCISSFRNKSPPDFKMAQIFSEHIAWEPRFHRQALNETKNIIHTILLIRLSDHILITIPNEILFEIFWYLC